jgi:hypothetical protein
MLTTIILITISSLFMFIAGMCRGLEDLLIFHWSSSYFDLNKKYNPKFWSVNQSWENKYDTEIKELPFIYGCSVNRIWKKFSDLVQKVFKLKTVITQLSDAFHFIKVLEYTFASLTITLVAFLNITWSPIFSGMLIFGLYSLLYVTGFNLTYNKLGPKKK